MTSIYEHLGCEGAVETIRNVVPELDTSQGARIHPLGIQDHKLSAVGLRDVELHQDKPVVLLTFNGALPAQPRHEDGLTHTAV